MSTIVTRQGKGTPLTNTEVDANFTNLNADKAEKTDAGLTRPVVSPYLEFNEADPLALPATPPAGKVRMYIRPVQGLSALEAITSSGTRFRFLRDQLYFAKNETGATIPRGTPVRIVNEAIAADDERFPLVAPARANASATMGCDGIAGTDILNGAYGRIYELGRIENVNTAGFAAGDRLYVSAAAAGALVNVPPTHPNLSQQVARVLRANATQGIILVNLKGVGGEAQGTRGNTFAIGDAAAGIKQVSFVNAGGSLLLRSNHTAPRTLDLPDTDGTLATQIMLGLRNKIINGYPIVNQVGAASVAAAGGEAYLVDMWSLESSLAGALLSFADDSAVSLVGPRHLFVSTTSVKANLAAGDFIMASHKIEGINSADLRMGRADAKSFTISFRAVASVAGVYSIAVRNSAVTRSYVTPIAIGVVPATYSVTIPGDTAGAWLTDNGIGLRVTLCFASGSTFRTAAINQWQAGSFISSDTQSNGLDTLNRSVSFSDVQLERGGRATPFEVRPLGMELALCQRYYESLRVSFKPAGGSRDWYNFRQPKRATPTLTYSYDSGGTGGAFAPEVSAVLQIADHSILSNGEVRAFSRL